MMLWMSDPDSLCTYVNRRWMDFTGRTMEAELGNGWVESVHPEDRQRCTETYTRAFDRREPYTVEYRLQRHDGEYRWIFDSAVPRFNQDGSFAGYMCSAVDVTDRKRVEEALSSLGGRLIEAQEQERRHIARELHDDISQKVAMLSLELQQFGSCLPDFPANIRDWLDSLVKRTAEINDDIHGLSHRLHSSKLDTLGLVATMMGFCRELAEQRDVQIDFIHNGVPELLPPSISLCVFRVLQEALTNAVKHSGVRRFTAKLARVADELELSVRDSGVGFDPAAQYNEGIGLISMRERVSLVGGRLSITSKPQGGTEITVCVPVSVEQSA
jgi:PAS domain S-box-containing protein